MHWDQIGVVADCNGHHKTVFQSSFKSVSAFGSDLVTINYQSSHFKIFH